MLKKNKGPSTAAMKGPKFKKWTIGVKHLDAKRYQSKITLNPKERIGVKERTKGSNQRI